MRAHGLEDYFDSIVAGDDGFGHKPSTLPFEKTLERLGARAAETLIIGDMQVDIQAGRASGCQTCWFAPDHNRFFHDFDNMRAIAPDHEIVEIRMITMVV